LAVTSKTTAWTLYDNTLRDGEQTVGVCFTPGEKVRIAQGLAKAGIPALEAGFAGVSRGERAAIAAVVKAVPGMKVYSLARLNDRDIEAASASGAAGVTLFAPASESLLRVRGYTREAELRSEIPRMVGKAKSLGLRVRFSCEDAARAPLARVLGFYRAAWKAGADSLSYADTTGVSVPEIIRGAVRTIVRAIPLPLSIHCHNDLGLAVANSMAAARAGAHEIQVTLNGLGERAGNTAAEELLLAAKVGYGADPGVDLRELMRLSRYLIRITGLEPGFNKPVIGRNAFRHESGIHVHGLLRPGVRAYEPFPPEWVGRRHEIAFGKHSGKSNIRFLCRQYGLVLNETQEQAVARRIKQVAEARRCGLNMEEVLQWVCLAAGGSLSRSV